MDTRNNIGYLQQLALNDDGFVFDPATGDSYILNASALAIVKGLKQGVSVSEIVANLICHFQVEEESAQRDVLEFQHRLQSLGLA